MHLAASLQTMLTLFLLAPAAGDAGELDRVGIGRQIDAFQLHDFRGKEHTLEDYADKQAVASRKDGDEQLFDDAFLTDNGLG